jgi:hypothetical protein
MDRTSSQSSTNYTQHRCYKYCLLAAKLIGDIAAEKCTDSSTKRKKRIDRAEDTGSMRRRCYSVSFINIVRSKESASLTIELEVVVKPWLPNARHEYAKAKTVS